LKCWLICKLAANFNFLVNLKNIVLIGAGNVATHLGMVLRDNGCSILQVYSRTEFSASKLAGILNANFTTSLKNINQEADLYIISVADDAVLQIAKNLNLKENLLVHTSGSLPMDVLEGVSENHGVLYPLQTFSKTRKIDFDTVPVCIEANNQINFDNLISLARQISRNVRKVNSAQRKQLHLAAVFACNFPNMMYFISEKIASHANLDFDMLRPLIMETAEKVMEIDPEKAQTGPAKREDQKIINQHLEMLNNLPEFKEIYKLISSEIQNSNK